MIGRRTVASWAAIWFAVGACAPAGESEGSAVPVPRDPGQEAPANTLTGAEIDEGWRLLFDGQSTAGWRAYNGQAFPDTGWAVVDGMLVVGATATDPDIAIGGDIVTDEQFSNFELQFDFKLSPVANSGVLYLVTEREGAEIWHGAPEFQVLDDQAYIDMGTMDMRTHLTGDNYDLHEAGEKTLRPLGEWNEGRIIVDGTRVQHWLNGRKTFLRMGLSVALAVAASVAAAACGDAVGERVEAPEAVVLFNGHDLTGWRVHGTERWYVDDGDLVCESGPDAEYGYLVTERTFTDFSLSLEFKQEADGNSGVFIRSSVEGTTVNGWQAEVAPPGLWTGGIYESYGRGWLVRPDSTLPDVRMGEWNEMRIRAVGDTVTTWLNGVERVTLVDEALGGAEGSIALQIHDGGGIKIRWRNVRLLDLSGR